MSFTKVTEPFLRLIRNGLNGPRHPYEAWADDAGHIHIVDADGNGICTMDPGTQYATAQILEDSRRRYHEAIAYANSMCGTGRKVLVDEDVDEDQHVFIEQDGNRITGGTFPTNHLSADEEAEVNRLFDKSDKEEE